jgi:hypothetical protein
MSNSKPTFLDEFRRSRQSILLKSWTCAFRISSAAPGLLPAQPLLSFRTKYGEGPDHKEFNAQPMLTYLSKRRCPKCAFDFVVVLLDCDSRMQWINGFCGKCEHNISWKLFRRRAAYEARNCIVDSSATTSNMGPRRNTSQCASERRTTTSVTGPSVDLLR